MYKKVLALFFVLMFSGCASTMTAKLGPLPTTEIKHVSISDERLDSEKKYSIPEMWIPIRILGDANFEPSLLDYFTSEVEIEAKKQSKKYEIAITRMRVIDNYAARVEKSQAGALAGIGVVSTGPDLFSGHDFVVFEFNGTIDGVVMEQKASCTYDTSPLSVTVLNDSNFKEALKKVVKEVVTKITQ